jgi:excisionase family DNA binding protein
MPPTTRPIKSSLDHNTNGDVSPNTFQPSRQSPSPALVACFLLPPEQVENLISMLQGIAAYPPNGSPHIAPMAAPTQESNPTWLTHSEAARYLGVAISTLYRYAEQERIECRKIGNRLEYRRASLDRFKESLIRPARRPRARGIIAPTLDSGN